MLRVLLLAVALVAAGCAGSSTARTDQPLETPNAPAAATGGVREAVTGGVREAATAAAGAPATAGAEPPAGGALEPSEGFALATLDFVDDGRRVTMPVLVANSAALRARGLMGRRSLPDDAGMVFVFDAPVTSAFWMKDTLLPLTIAFVGQDGTVQQLTDMDPCRADPCPRYAPEQPYRFAVEANRGFFASRGITPGWVIEFPDDIGVGS